MSDPARTAVTRDREPIEPFWRMKPTERFTDRARDYARHRPGYPAEAVDAILDGLAESSSLTAADVGAGTGISARLLAERGLRVLAVEPNRAMRDAVEPHPGVEYRDGSAERTGLADACLDLVLCAQSFHWFEPEPALAEFCRVLRPGGRLAVMWNERAEDDVFTAGYTRLVREAAGGRETEAGHERLEELLPRSGFEGARRLEFRHGQDLTVDGLVGRARSASYVPLRGPEHDRLVEGLQDLHRRFRHASGHVRLVYRTVLYLARAPVSRPAR